MAIFAAFNIASMGKQQYEQVINTLDIQEKGLVDGCLHHVVSFTSDGLLVGDVWEMCGSRRKNWRVLLKYFDLDSQLKEFLCLSRESTQSITLSQEAIRHNMPYTEADVCVRSAFYLSSPDSTIPPVGRENMRTSRDWLERGILAINNNDGFSDIDKEYLTYVAQSGQQLNGKHLRRARGLMMK